MPSEYRTWVPTVSGYLSFSHMGGVHIHGRIFEEQCSRKTLSDGSQWISLLQNRNLSDRPKVGVLNQNPKPGKHTFLLQGIATDGPNGTKTLRGIIYSVPRVSENTLKALHTQPDLSAADPAKLLVSLKAATLQANTTARHLCERYYLEISFEAALAFLQSSEATEFEHG